MLKDPSHPYIQITSSRMMSPRSSEQRMEPDKGIEAELLDTGSDILILASFEGRDKQDLLHSNACLLCSTTEKLRCQLRL